MWEVLAFDSRFHQTAQPYITITKRFRILTSSPFMTVFSLDGKPMQLANQTRIYYEDK